MNKENAKNILKEVVGLVPEAWPFGATLLGFIREGKIIDWDGDIDLGILSEHVTPGVIQAFRDHGFQVFGDYKYSHPGMDRYISPEKIGKEYGKFIVRKDGIKVEMCCFTEGLDGRFYYASGTPRFFVLDRDMIFPLTTIDWKLYGFSMTGPEKDSAIRQLVHVYGSDWKKPKKDWYFTPDHYLRREYTIIELTNEDDGSKWSKWEGRKVIAKKYPNIKFPDDINTPVVL